MANIHIIIGEDDYLVDQIAKKTIGDGVGLEVIDSLTSTNADLQLSDVREADASLLTPPFLDPKKVTWWKNVNFLPGASGKKVIAEDVKLALEKFAKRLVTMRLPENQHFILSGTKLLKTSIFAKTLSDASTIEMVVMESGKPWQMKKFAVSRIVEFAAEMKLKFEREAAEMFVDRVGIDSRSLVNELAKMREYLGPKSHTITKADVAAISSQGAGVEAAIFDLTDAITERNLAASLDKLKRFELENGFAVIVSSAVERLFRQLLEIKDARTEEELAIAAVGIPAWKVDRVRHSLTRWTPRELRVARFRFLKLRERAVSSSGEVDSLVPIEIIRTIGTKRI